MPNVIDRDRVRQLVEQQAAQLVEVLPRAEYDAEHLAGAVSLPLKQLSAATAATLDRARPVITYCHDGL
jgi:rhodanese-related sulfurtransferase